MNGDHMNRLLRIAEFWYGREVCARVFEPLLADRDGECRHNRSMLMRIRWSLAFASTFIICLPIRRVVLLSAILAAGLVLRTIGFGTVAFVFQRIFGAYANSHPAAMWPPSIVTTLPFLTMPVVWRIRTAEIPHHQKRLLMIVFALMAVTISAAATHTWQLAAGYAVSILLVTLFGWIPGDRERQTRTELARKWWMRIIMIQAALSIAMWPIKFAVDVRFTGELWPGGYLLIYLYAAVIAAWMTHARDEHTAPTR